MRKILFTVHAFVLALAVALFVLAAAPAHGETTEEIGGVVAQENEPSPELSRTEAGEADAERTEASDVVSDDGTSPADDDAEAADTGETEDQESAAETVPTGDDAAAQDVPETADEEAVTSDVTADADELAEEPELSAQAVADATSEEQKALDAYAAKHANDLAAGRYRIMNALSASFSLSVSGASKSNGAKVVIWTSSTATNQRWELVSVGGGYFAIRNVCSGKYLEVSGSDSAAANGVPVVQWAKRSASSRSQRWIVVRTPKGYQLVSGVAEQGGTRLVLSVSGGKVTRGAAAVLATEKAGATEQLWKLSVPVDVLDALAAQHKADLADGLYVASSKLAYSGGKKLDLSVKGASKADNASVIVAGRATSALKTYDVWSVSHTSKGYVIIKDCYTGKVLHVSGGTAKEKTPVVQYADKKGKSRSQLWVATKQEDGSYKLVSALEGDAYLTLQVSGSKAVSETKTVLAKSTDRKSQSWAFATAPARFSNMPALDGKIFVLKSSLDLTKVLGAYKSYKAAGTRAVIVTETHASSQHWKVTYDINGYAHLVNENSGLQLGVNSDGKAIEAAGKYRWLIESTAGDTYTLTSKTGAFSGKLLTVKDAKTADNTNVVAQPYGKGASQRWSILGIDSGLNGVDVSGWNTDINYTKLGDFVIVKATEWNSEKRTYTSYNNYQDKADKVLAAGKVIGFSHFATNPNTSKQSMAKQAEGFIKAVSVKNASGNYKYLGRAVLFLDWEDTSYSNVETDEGVTWAKQWLDYVYTKTGIKPIIYMNKNCTNAHNWSSVVKAGYALWGAQYLDRYYNEDPSQMITSFVASPRLTDGWGAWGTPLIYQYTATARLHGNKVYDVNKFYGTRADWLRLAAMQ